MSRKLVSVLVIVALMLATFSSVSAQLDTMSCPEGSADLVIAAGAVGIELEVIQEQAARLNEMCPNITLTPLETPDLATDRLALYQQFWEARDSNVDIYQTDVIWAGIIAPHVVDMYDYVTPEYIGQFFPAMVEGQTIDGRLVAIPWFTDAAGLYYRTDLLEKYGVEVPTTWDELEAAAALIQEGERAEGNSEFFGYVWQGNSYEGLTCDAHEWLVSATGNTFITPEGEVNVNTPEFIAALEQAAGWVGTISPEAVTTFGEEDSRAVWQSGNAAFMRNWPYAYGLGNSEDSAVAGNFGYAPLPAGASGRAAACLGGWQIAVSAYSDNVDAAAFAAMFLASAEEQKLRALSAQGPNPTIPAIYEDPELLEANPLFNSMGPILATAVARPSGFTASRYNDASAIFYSAVHSVLTGSVDARTAVEDLEL
ncbi:ABC transporter substrate-binding protein, partial [Anaerolineae bacterium CFX9]|nr:ABC transporter substrate-binding protein [Anaerolineae bacterium CFX9]